MRDTQRRLVLASTASLACSALATAVAIRRRLPAEFGGILRGEDVARDFVTFKGTALSAPLWLLAAQAACTVLAARSDRGGRAGVAGVAGLALLGAAQVAGQFGEPVVYRALRPATFAPGRAAMAAANLMCSTLVAGLGLAAWREQATPPAMLRGT